jgi:integrase/recombinase XerC
MNSSAAGPAELDAARLLLARMGISPSDLVESASQTTPAPTSAEYIPVVSAAVSDGTRRAYGPYWNRVLDQWGDRRLYEPTPSDIERLMDHVRSRVVVRRNARGGRGASEHLIAALRCLYRRAIADGLVTAVGNPALKVAKPRRLASTRRAVADVRLAEINHIAATTGNDPALDALLIRLHTETGCRRGGALALRPADLDVEQCLNFLREKGGTVRWQPVSPTLMRHLVRHSLERKAPGTEQLLRARNGRPITKRRYDYLWGRIGDHLPWVAVQQITSHWLRHTTLTWVERNFGYAVARGYAGHADSGGDSGATTTYVRASLQEIATALSALTGEPHPLCAQPID